MLRELYLCFSRCLIRVDGIDKLPLEVIHLGCTALPNVVSDLSEQNAVSGILADCRAHRALAHTAVLEWALALSSLALPAYVVLHIFEALGGESHLETYVFDHDEEHYEYEKRTADQRVAVPAQSENVDANYFNIAVEERTHNQNIAVFIAVQRAHQKTKAFREMVAER